MSSSLVIMAVGPDRPGLVDDISSRLADRGVNIESSHMAAVGGLFSVILLVSGTEDQVQELADAARALVEDTEFEIFIKRARVPPSGESPAYLPYRLTTAGMDHPGIVKQISKLLHGFDVNIDSLDTKVKPAPVSGVPIFMMEARLSVPAEVRKRKIREALIELGDELNMDIEFEPVE